MHCVRGRADAGLVPVLARPGLGRATAAAVDQPLGNLTLLTGRLNSKVSNGPWLGTKGKLALLDSKDVLLLNRRIRQAGQHGWDENKIRDRTQQLIETVLTIWPVPEGHLGLPATVEQTDALAVGIADLISDGLLTAGQTLHARGKWAPATAIVLADGRLQVGEDLYDTPSGAGKAVKKRATNGWHFWLTSEGGDTCLRDLRTDYAARFVPPRWISSRLLPPRTRNCRRRGRAQRHVRASTRPAAGARVRG